MKQMMSILVGSALLVLPAQADLKSDVAAIRQVGGEGKGNVQAAAAWQSLAKGGAQTLVPLLAAMDDANDFAANYLRSAVDAIADRELAAGRKLPQDDLEKFLADRVGCTHRPRGRGEAAAHVP